MLLDNDICDHKEKFITKLMEEVTQLSKYDCSFVSVEALEILKKSFSIAKIYNHKYPNDFCLMHCLEKYSFINNTVLIEQMDKKNKEFKNSLFKSSFDKQQKINLHMTIKKSTEIALLEGRLVNPIDLVIALLLKDNSDYSKFLCTNQWSAQFPSNYLWDSQIDRKIPINWTIQFLAALATSYPNLIKKEFGIDAKSKKDFEQAICAQKEYKRTNLPIDNAQPNKPDQNTDDFKEVDQKDKNTKIDKVDFYKNFNPDYLWEILSQEFPWMENANLILCQNAAMICSKKRAHMLPMLLVGEPGIGKTKWCLRVCELLKLPNLFFTVGGSTSGAAVSGFERTWNNSEPSLVSKVIKEHGNNAAIIMDEIDKYSNSASGGTIPESLLPLLNPLTAKRYRDLYSNKTVDASQIFWMLTANSLSSLTQAFLDRVEIVHVRKPLYKEIENIFTSMQKSEISNDDCLEMISDNQSQENYLKDMDCMRKAYQESGSIRAAERALKNAQASRQWSPPTKKKEFNLKLVE